MILFLCVWHNQSLLGFLAVNNTNILDIQEIPLYFFIPVRNPCHCQIYWVFCKQNQVTQALVSIITAEEESERRKMAWTCCHWSNDTTLTLGQRQGLEEGWFVRAYPEQAGLGVHWVQFAWLFALNCLSSPLEVMSLLFPGTPVLKWHAEISESKRRTCNHK